MGNHERGLSRWIVYFLESCLLSIFLLLYILLLLWLNLTIYFPLYLGPGKDVNSGHHGNRSSNLSYGIDPLYLIGGSVCTNSKYLQAHLTSHSQNSCLLKASYVCLMESTARYSRHFTLKTLALSTTVLTTKPTGPKASR